MVNMSFNMENNKTDYLIIGAGIIGLGIARALIQKNNSYKIAIIEKEPEICFHASGRNSGVLHAGFYYTEESLKAKFSVEGNKMLTNYCEERSLPISKIGKLVVASNATELEGIYELERRGKKNGCTVHVISEEEAQKIDPNVQTHKKALWSPLTSTVDPGSINLSLKKELEEKGVEFFCNSGFVSKEVDSSGETLVQTSSNKFLAKKVFNCSGLYSDKIAKNFGFSKDYTIVPFKGLYLKYTKNKTDIKTNIYPVPNLNQTFLGVHYTKTVDGTIKIGPTAIPAFWRENYHWFSRFKISELVSILGLEAILFLSNSFGFRDLAFEEMKKYSKPYLISLAQKMVNSIDPEGFTEFSKPGIRAQLVHKKTRKLVMDFIIEGDKKSVHILNAISPGYTCSIPFSEYVVDKYGSLD